MLKRLNQLLHRNNPINSFMMRHPKKTSVGLTCLKTFAADLVVQFSVEKKKSLKEIDWTRTSVFALFGFAYLGVFQYWLYNFGMFYHFILISF